MVFWVKKQMKNPVSIVNKYKWIPGFFALCRLRKRFKGDDWL